jgi:hypothetical protein
MQFLHRSRVRRRTESNLPAKSKAQFRWLHTDDAKKALGKAGVKEWEGATGSPKNLPEKVTLRKRATGGKRKT